MARKSMIEKNNERKVLAVKFRARREALKVQIKDPNLGLKDKVKLIQKLDNLPRDSSEVRYRNRCSLTGRPRGFNRKLGICRIKMRELVEFIPGFKKASW
jgi:small subunit ribosomal protein S14